MKRIERFNSAQIQGVNGCTALDSGPALQGNLFHQACILIECIPVILVLHSAHSHNQVSKWQWRFMPVTVHIFHCCVQVPGSCALKRPPCHYQSFDCIELKSWQVSTPCCAVTLSDWRYKLDFYWMPFLKEIHPNISTPYHFSTLLNLKFVYCTLVLASALYVCKAYSQYCRGQYCGGC